MTPPRRYPVPAATVRVEDRIEHSRFITTLVFADSADAAKSAIQRVRDEFPDATHHCFAYVAGPPGSTSSSGASDAGEPSGTAGRPMLKVLLNSGVGDVAVVVTRYFGGVKLGKGGLVRAYSGGVQHALRELQTREHVDEIDATAVVPYTAMDAVQRALAREGVRVVAMAFGASVALSLRIPADREDDIERLLADTTAGAARLER
ncbi:MAG TPA: YigZ family protein [Candidatus Krumholzibacteria bacterium]|nr:YigZ family protein [Candidatus Krumholzibacteria bacterium]